MQSLTTRKISNSSKAVNQSNYTKIFPSVSKRKDSSKLKAKGLSKSTCCLPTIKLTSIQSESKNRKKSLKSKNREKLNKLYNINSKYIYQVKKIKKSNDIALSRHFNIDNYQTKLLELASKCVSYEGVKSLRDDFHSMNQRIEGKVKLTSSWESLAKQLENIAPQHLLNKLHSMGGQKFK